MRWGARRGWVPAGAIFLVSVMRAAFPATEPYRWTFEGEVLSEPPRGWEVLSGRWEVRLDDDGPNRVLVQTGPSPSAFDLPAILAPAEPVRDLRVAVRLKPAGSGAFETMALILRWRDPGTMTVIRVDGTPGRVWVDRLQGGRRSLRAGYVVPFRRGRWNALRVVAEGDRLDLFLDGRFLGRIPEDDPVPGRVGLMAGPDAGVLLDDLVVEASPTTAIAS